MRRWGAGAVMLVLLLGLYLLWPERAAPPPADLPVGVAAAPSPSPSRNHAARPADPPATARVDEGELLAGASGELGIQIRNRVCALCASGTVDATVCEACPPAEGPYGRVFLDVVGEDGRPLPPHEASIAADCAPMGMISSGHLDLPVGPCTLIATRVDGLLTVVGDAVELEITENGELYANIEVPTEPWGATGLDLTLEGDEAVVRRLIPGTAIGDAVPVGAVILEVDGMEVGGLSLGETARTLNGPVGSTVELRFRDPATGDERTVEVERSRLSNEHVAPDMIPG